ncbi:hypothetical protein LINPERHAP2_LOCUS34190 [Linum perenne]
MAEVTTQEIRLHCVVRNYPIEIPNGLFNGVIIFRSLKVVKLRRCRFPSDSSNSSVVSFGDFLRVLSLKHVTFPDGEDRILNSMIQGVSSTLETLTLSHVSGIRRLQVRDLPNLKALKASNFRCGSFEITGVRSLEILHACINCWRKEEIRVSLVPNKVRVVNLSGTYSITNEDLNEFISVLPSLEFLKLNDLPETPVLKINANNHKLLRAIWLKYRASLPKVIGIDAPMLTNFIFERMEGLEFPSLLINKVADGCNETAARKPAVQVSVCCRTLCHNDWVKLKQFLDELSEFQLTLELNPYQGESTWISTNYGDDELHCPMNKHMKLSLKLLSLCDDVDVFVINLFRYCRPKILSFSETGDEVVPKKYIIHLKNILKHLMKGFGRRSCQGEYRSLHKQLKNLKVMKRVMNNEEIELITSNDLILFLEDPKQCRIVLDWH